MIATLVVLVAIHAVLNGNFMIICPILTITEEWVTKKKIELTTTKQIETRVKRQVVLEDGKVVDDSGPIVTTSTTEDTDKKESEQTEVNSQVRSSLYDVCYVLKIMDWFLAFYVTLIIIIKSFITFYGPGSKDFRFQWLFFE